MLIAVVAPPGVSIKMVLSELYPNDWDKIRFVSSALSIGSRTLTIWAPKAVTPPFVTYNAALPGT